MIKHLIAIVWIAYNAEGLYIGSFPTVDQCATYAMEFKGYCVAQIKDKGEE